MPTSPPARRGFEAQYQGANQLVPHPRTEYGVCCAAWRVRSRHVGGKTAVGHRQVAYCECVGSQERGAGRQESGKGVVHVEVAEGEGEGASEA